MTQYAQATWMALAIFLSAPNIPNALGMEIAGEDLNAASAREVLKSFDGIKASPAVDVRAQPAIGQGSGRKPPTPQPPPASQPQLIVAAKNGGSACVYAPNEMLVRVVCPDCERDPQVPSNPGTVFIQANSLYGSKTIALQQTGPHAGVYEAAVRLGLGPTGYPGDIQVDRRSGASFTMIVHGRVAAWATACASPLEARPAEGPADEKTAAKGWRHLLRLSGTVAVNGGGDAPWPGGYVTLRVSGPAQLWDDEGRIIEGSVWLSDTRTFPVSGRGVEGWVEPGADVALYREGIYVGTLWVHGSVFVSGTGAGGWVNVSGSGGVYGEGYVQDP